MPCIFRRLVVSNQDVDRVPATPKPMIFHLLCQSILLLSACGELARETRSEGTCDSSALLRDTWKYLFLIFGYNNS